MSRSLIIFGIILILIGISLPVLQKMGIGRLPGDIYIKKEHVTFYFPLTTSILISLGLSLVLYFFGRK